MNISPHPSTPNLVPDPSPRDPRVHRQTGIPSIFRPNGSSNVTNNGPNPSNTKKKRSYHLLSIAKFTPRYKDRVKDKDKGSGNDDEDSLVPSNFSRRRFASMPQLLPSDFQQISIENAKIAKGLGSPPIVDFTRFEDTYRGARNGDFEGLIAQRSTEKARGFAGGMRSRSIGVKPALKTDTPACITTLSSTGSGSSPHPASERKPDPRLLLSALRDILGPSQRIEDYFDAHELLGAHQLDQLDFEEREAVKAGSATRGKLEVQGLSGPLVILGEPIRKASIYSTTTMVLAGREHELPILVVNCIEELYRTGIYQPNLFRALPNRYRLLELIDIFDSEKLLPGSIIRSRSRQQSSEDNSKNQTTTTSGFGALTSLHLESTPDICALLASYLTALPESIITPVVFRAIWDWCGLEQEESSATDDDDDVDDGDDGTLHELRQRRLSSVPLTRTYTSPTESTHILIAQLLLHLLPSAHFSLFVYLLAFFSQVALVREENGAGVEDLANMFGAQIFGSGVNVPGSVYTAKEKGKAKAPSNPTSSGEDPLSNIPLTQMPATPETTQLPSRNGECMMCWFLRRWGPISDGLFEVADDARMGLFRRTLARRDSLGKDILSTWLPQPTEDAGLAFGAEGEPVATASTPGPLLTHSEELQSSKWTKRVPVPRINIIEGSPPSHSTPKLSKTIKEYHKLDSPMQEADIVDYSDDYVDYAVLTPTPALARSFPFPQDEGENETLDITHLPATSRVLSNTDTESVYSAMSASQSLDERLMDVSMPTSLLDQTLPTTTATIPGEPERRVHAVQTRTYSSRATQTDAHSQTAAGNAIAHHTTQSQPPNLDFQQPKLVKALQLITDLEDQLKERTECLTDALRDLGRCKLDLEASQRRHRVRELEKDVIVGICGGGGRQDRDRTL